MNRMVSSSRRSNIRRACNCFCSSYSVLGFTFLATSINQVIDLRELCASFAENCPSVSIPLFYHETVVYKRKNQGLTSRFDLYTLGRLRYLHYSTLVVIMHVCKLTSTIKYPYFLGLAKNQQRWCTCIQVQAQRIGIFSCQPFSGSAFFVDNPIHWFVSTRVTGVSFFN